MRAIPQLVSAPLNPIPIAEMVFRKTKLFLNVRTVSIYVFSILHLS